MRIYKFYSEGFKRLKVVDITPAANVQVISGANEAGKSSILDAICATLSLRDIKKQVPQPIGKDYAKALVEIDLGEYIVTRTFTNNGETTALKITRQNGDEVHSPQKILDGLLGDLSFDPLKFSRENFASQKERIASALKIDLNNLDKTYQVAYDKRTELNKRRSSILQKLSTIKPPSPEETVPRVNLEKLYEQLHKSNQKAALISRREELLKELERVEKNIASYEDITDSPENILQRIKAEQSLVQRDKEIQEFKQLEIWKEEADKEIDKCNAAMELAKIEKSEAIEKAKLSIDGFEIREDGIYINSVPWSQISQAQKIKYSIAIAIASNPKLRVLLISDGSLLDSQSLKVIEDIAIKHDYQVWIEMVDETNTRGIFLEAGEVKGVHND